MQKGQHKGGLMTGGTISPTNGILTGQQFSGNPSINSTAQYTGQQIRNNNGALAAGATHGLTSNRQ